MDILFRNLQPEAAVPGGSCFNSIISLGRARVPSVFVGYTGGDIVGRQTVDFLHDNGVCTDYFEMREGEKSAISLAYLNQQGDADYIFYKPTPHVSPTSPIPEFHKNDVMLYGSYYAICESTHGQVDRLLDAASRAEVIVYYDLNFRRSHQHELDTLLPVIHDNFHHSSIVRGSADDFEIMYGERDARTIYEKHIREHCPIFICTSGPGLITVCTPSQSIDFPVPAVKTISTVGAGDNFNAGFIYATVTRHIHKKDLPTLTQEDWQQIIGIGQRFSAAVCQSINNYVDEDFAKTILDSNG